ncbi:ATP-binding cassette domain-containing protein [Bacillus thuringiensis]|nr:ATP-binding cassette domain-containing protein [Bacillus thuringiensis]
MTSLLKLDKVSKVYGEGNTEVTALHPMSLDVKAGEFIGIVGPSGSGKVRYYQLLVLYYHRQKGYLHSRAKYYEAIRKGNDRHSFEKNRLHFPVCKPCSIFKCERTVTLHCKAKKKVNKNPESVQIIY